MKEVSLTCEESVLGTAKKKWDEKAQRNSSPSSLSEKDNRERKYQNFVTEESSKSLALLVGVH